jgi:peptidoglycan/LPS O-acetylase OafA/YrhL
VVTLSGDRILLIYTNPIVLEFLAGILLAESRFQSKIPGLVGGSFALIVGVAGLWFAPMDSATDIWRFVLRGAPSFLLVAGMIILEARGVMLSSAFLIFSGDVSYSLYLSHVRCHACAANLACFSILRRRGSRHLNRVYCWDAALPICRASCDTDASTVF